MEYNVNETHEPMYPHICGRCRLGFLTEEEYCQHTCMDTGYTPQDPEHLGEAFRLIQEAALKRGAERQAQEQA